MFNNLNSETIKSILENTAKISDETATKIDEILSKNDLEKIYDNTCPITGEVFEKLKESMANPKNLKLVATCENGEYDLYIEASEFANYCEATGLDIKSAVESILEEYKEITPGIKCDKFHVVFPANKTGIDKIGVDKLGMENEDSWANKLIHGCMQFGIPANVGVDKSDVVEPNDDTEEVEQD